MHASVNAGALTSSQHSNTGRKRSRISRVRQYWPEYLCIAPFFVIFGIFFAYPIVWSAILSFQRWDGVNDATWVGFDNYQYVLQDPLTRQMFTNTIAYLVLLVPLGVLLPMMLGVILNNPRLRLRGVFRTAVFIPVVTSMVTVGIVFRFIFAKANGWLNGILGEIGIEPLGWLTEPDLAKYPVSALTIWSGLGFSTLIVLGGLQSIDQDIYDAAKVDGAGHWNTFWRITIPLLRPVMVFLIITSTISVMTMFAQPYVLTNGGPSNSTLTPLLYIYNIAFRGRIGDAAALSFLLSAFMLIITAVQYRVMRARDV